METAVLEQKSEVRSQKSEVGGPKPEKRELDPQLLARVKSVFAELGLKNADLARAIGYSDGMISSLLGNKYNGDIVEVTKRLEEWLASLSVQDNLPTISREYVETAATKKVIGALETIKAVKTLGLIVGAAGTGKTTAACAYQAKRQLTIMFPLVEGHGDNWTLERTLYKILSKGRKAAGLREYDSRCEFVFDTLLHSGRLVVIDQAHRLTASGIRWLCDLNQDMRVPIALIGNAEIDEKLRGVSMREQSRNEQNYSRCIFRTVIPPDWGADELHAIVRHYIAKPEAAFLKRCQQIADGAGHVRSLVGVLVNARIKIERGTEPLTALERAYKQLRPVTE